jgi:S-adenosyl-L-methionine hydrolase (adenosine-forming)
MSIITLTTDFGNADGFVGVMKGVILSIAPETRLIDLSHDIAPQDVRQAAHVLARAVPYFPPGTVHLAVVDPGVGSERRGLVVASGPAFFVGPDNGLFTGPLARAGARAFDLDRPEYWLPQVSQTFHGRDVFAPVAAHLAQGSSPEKMGRPVTDAVRLPDPSPARRPDGMLAGEVVYVDHFGNLITNIPGDWVAGSRDWQCSLGERSTMTVGRLSSAYADVPPGHLVALVSSGGTVEVAIRDGNAAEACGLGRGARVLLAPTSAA